MKRVLITGGTGTLGSKLTPRLRRDGYMVRVLSRRAAPDDVGDVEWAQAFLATGEGLAEAVADVDAVVHLASSPFRNTEQVDVKGTERLLAVASEADVVHFVYISIVGVDRIPFGYYQHKLAAERIVEGGGVPWSILRATQFHSFADQIIGTAARLPVLLLPTAFQAQLIDAGEVADRLVEIVAQGPGGRLPDIGGPEVQMLGELAREWLAARDMGRPVVRLPLPGQVAAGFRKGFNTVPENRYGSITWTDWLGRSKNR